MTEEDLDRLRLKRDIEYGYSRSGFDGVADLVERARAAGYAAGVADGYAAGLSKTGPPAASITGKREVVESETEDGRAVREERHYTNSSARIVNTPLVRNEPTTNPEVLFVRYNKPLGERA